MNKNFYNLFIELKKLDDMFNDALIVVDTNVLLMAYQWRDTTFKTVYDILNELMEREKLKIPSQVIKEFANKRPQTIKDLSNDLHDKILSKLEKGKSEHHSLNKVIPGLEFFEDKEELIDSEKKYNEAIESLRMAQKEYKNSLNSHLDKIKTYIDNDPILLRFRNIFENAVLIDPKHDQGDLEKELERRKKENIPPGYKDKGHLGDLKIWMEILSLSNHDVIFITRDNKNDWVYKDNKDNIMGARRELVEEFYSSHNKTFKILSPLDFIEKYSKNKGLNVEKEVKEDIEKSVSISSQFENLEFDQSVIINGEDLNLGQNKHARLRRLSKKAWRRLSALDETDLINEIELRTLYDDIEYANSIQNYKSDVAESIYLNVIEYVNRVIRKRNKDSDM